MRACKAELTRITLVSTNSNVDESVLMQDILSSALQPLKSRDRIMIWRVEKVERAFYSLTSPFVLQQLACLVWTRIDAKSKVTAAAKHVADNGVGAEVVPPSQKILQSPQHLCHSCAFLYAWVPASQCGGFDRSDVTAVFLVY